MKAEDIIKLIVTLTPYAIQAGVSIADTVKKFQKGSTLDELIAEANEKRDNIPELSFAADSQA